MCMRVCCLKEDNKLVERNRTYSVTHSRTERAKIEKKTSRYIKLCYLGDSEKPAR